MADPIANLLVRIGSDVSGIVQGGKKAAGSLKGMSDQAAKTAKAITAMGAAGAAALTALTVRQARVIDQTAKVSSTLGIAIDKLQAYRLVAEESGLATNTFDMALQRMARRVAEAAKGTGEAQGALKELRLDAMELAEMSLEDQFKEVASAMQLVESQSERIRLGFKLFDSEGVKVVNMLEDFSDRSREAEEFQRKFNITISDIDARKVEEANDAFGRIGDAIGGLGNTIAVETAPLITAMSQSLLDAGIDGEDFGKAVKGGMAVAATAIDTVRRAVIGLEFIFTKAVIHISNATAEVADDMNRFAEASASFWSKILPGEREARTVFTDIAEDARNMAEAGEESINELLKSLEGYETFAEKIRTIQDEATARAEEGEGGGLIDQLLGTGNTEEFDKTMQTRLEKLQEAFLSEQELLQMHYEADLELLRAALEAKQITEEEYANLRLQTHQKLQKDMTDVEKREQASRLQATQKYLSGIATATNSSNKTMFALGKAAAIAQALISARTSIVEAYEWGTSWGGPPAGAAAAAVAAAAQAANIASIKATSFESGGGVTATGGRSGTAIAAQTERQQQQQQQSQTIRLQGVDADNLFSGRQLIELINEATRNGSRIVLA